MATNKVSLDDFGRVYKRMLEIGTKLKQGALEPDKVLDGLQTIINKQVSFTPRLEDFDDPHELLFRHALCQKIGALFVGRLESDFGWHRVQFRTGWNFCDQQGNILSEHRFYELDYPQGIFARAKLTDKNDSWVFIDNQGKLLAPCDLAGTILPVDDLHYFSEGLAVVKIAHINPAYNFLQPDGKLLLATNVWWAQDFSEGLAVVKTSNQRDSICFIDITGQISILGDYLEAKNFSEGFAAVKDRICDESWHYIDHQGRKLNYDQSNLYLHANNFSNGWARVTRTNYIKSNGEGYYFISKTGKENLLTADDNWECTDFKDGLAIIEIYGKCRIINILGKTIIETKHRILIAGKCLFWVRTQTNEKIWSLIKIIDQESIEVLYQIESENYYKPFVGEWAKATNQLDFDGSYINYIDQRGKLFSSKWFTDQDKIDCHPGREGLAVEIFNNHANFFDRFGRTVFSYKISS